MNARRDAVLFLVGMTVSQVGDTALALVAAIWTKELTGSTALASIVAVCIYAPMVLAPFAGVLADRLPRRRLIVVVNAAMVLVVPLLWFVEGRGQVWLVCLVMLAYGSAAAVVDPAERALFSELFDDDTRARLNGLQMSLQEGCKLVCPAVGVALYAAYGGRSVAVLDAATFAVAAVLVALVGRRVTARSTAPAATVEDAEDVEVVEHVEDPTPSSRWHELGAGFGFVRRRRDLRAVTLLAAVMMTVAGLSWAGAYAVADSLGHPATFVGWLTGALGAGSIVAGLLSARIARRVGEVGLAACGAAACAVGFALATVPSTVVDVAAWCVRGFGLPWLALAAFTLAQRITPAHLQGRVAAAVGFGLFATQPVAYLAGAALFGAVDHRAVFAALAVVGVIGVIALRPVLAGRERADSEVLVAAER